MAWVAPGHSVDRASADTQARGSGHSSPVLLQVPAPAEVAHAARVGEEACQGVGIGGAVGCGLVAATAQVQALELQHLLLAQGSLGRGQALGQAGGQAAVVQRALLLLLLLQEHLSGALLSSLLRLLLLLGHLQGMLACVTL